METDAREVVWGEGEKYIINNYIVDPDDIEKITIPPSSELIPDEYEHSDNNKGLVIVFHSKFDVDNVTTIKNEFSAQGYEVAKDNVFKLTNKEYVLTALDNISSANNEEKTCLIIFFLGSVEREDQFLLDDEEDVHILLKDVWLRFRGDNCPSFKNKPKICIFQACSKPILTTVDTRKRSVCKIPPKGAYDLPSEADMLLVYKRIKDCQKRCTFITSLCNQIAKFGLKDDIISLITRTPNSNENETRPLVVSTLTRKFYINTNGDKTGRGHYYNIHNNQTNTMDALNELQQIIGRSSIEGRPSQSASTSRPVTRVDSAKPNPAKLVKKTEKVLKKKTKLEHRPPWVP